MNYEKKYHQLMELCLEFSKAVIELNDKEIYERLTRKIAEEKGLEEYINEVLKAEQGVYKTKSEK